MEAVIQFTFLEALLIGLYYWYAWWDLSIFPLNSLVIWQDPPVIGLIFGLIYGDVTMGLIIGGTIGLMYMGITYVGANVPSDTALACCVAIPIALKYGWSVEMAVTVATAFGVMGSFLDTLRRLINGFWSRQAHKHVTNRQYSKLHVDAILGPIGVGFIIRCIPLTLIMYLGGSAMGNVGSILPDFVMRGFTAIGGILPALGLVLCLAFIGKKSLFPFFAIAFFVAYLTGWNNLVMFVLAICAAALYMQFTAKSDDAESSLDLKKLTEGGPSTSNLTRKDHWQNVLHQGLWFRVSQSLESFFGTGYCYAMWPTLRKIYKDDDDGFQEAMERHLTPFITEPNFGACIHGIAMAMEEKKAQGDPISGESIVAIKTSLMGPLAGLGDSVLWGTIWVLLRSIFTPMAVEGNVAGILTGFIQTAIALAAMWYSYNIGFKAGGGAIVAFLKSGVLNKVLTGAGVLGYFMMGSLAAHYVTVSSPLEFTVNNIQYSLQGIFDSILPGLLPFAVCCIGFLYMSRGGKYSRMLLASIVIGLVGGFIGILG